MADRGPRSRFDSNKFELVHQVGGIRTARFDWPDAGGSPGCRVALVDTGSGLRYVVALDRGGDVVEASYQGTNLAYLTANGYQPPSHSLQHYDDDWLSSWPGGLVTSCGPRYMGPGREEDGLSLYLHGPHSNTPAALLTIHNPDPSRGDLEMFLEMTIRDTRMYGPSVEVRRRIVSWLGEPRITFRDEVVNLGNTTVAHNWLYHVNLGYPLLDEGARIVSSGQVTGVWDGLDPPKKPAVGTDFSPLKVVPALLAEHAGTGSRGLVMDIAADEEGVAHVGLVNPQRSLAVELEYPSASLPRMANWQHFGPRGSYVCGLEPFSGSLFGKLEEKSHPLSEQWLEAGASRMYELNLHVLTEEAHVAHLLSHDARLSLADH